MDGVPTPGERMLARVCGYHPYATDQEGMLAVARIAMGWPVLLVTSPVSYLVIRSAMRAMPRP